MTPPPRPQTNARRGLLAALGLAVIALVAYFLWSPSAIPKKFAAPLTLVPEPEPPRPPPPASMRAPTRAPAVGPIIDEILVEKKEVCEGEENLITVRAHVEDSRDDVHLHGTINGVPGLSVPVMGKKSDPPAKIMVVVFGRDNARTTAEVPPFVVKNCVVDRALTIQHGLRINTSSEYELTAQVVNVSAGDPYEAVSYFWEFGDGTTLTTTQPYATHDYGQRPQLSEYSSMLVQVEAESRSHEYVVGRKSILLRNPEFANLENAGVVTLVVDLTPRFPRYSEGIVTQDVRLWHHRPQPVRIQEVRARRNSTLPNVAPEVREISVTGLLGTTSIPPSGIRFTMQIDARAEPNTASIDYLLKGVSAEGYPVQSVFSIMKPNLPTRENHIPVVDPLLTQKILLARKILGKEYVTDGDLAELQRNGLFDELGSPAASAPKSAELPPAYNQ